MYKNNPKISGFVTAHFIAADTASFTTVLQYPPPIVYKVPLMDKVKFSNNQEIQVQKFREYRLEAYKFSKFGEQTIAIYREIVNN